MAWGRGRGTGQAEVARTAPEQEGSCTWGERCCCEAERSGTWVWWRSKSREKTRRFGGRPRRSARRCGAH
eukprot:109406-Rhodomonas_salina.1